MAWIAQFELFHRWTRGQRWIGHFAWFTRILLALGFTPSGWTKLAGNRFTSLPLDNPVGFFFEALFRTGFYWNFLGFAQLCCAALLLFPRTALMGAICYFPIILNIFLITVSMNFRGTPLITGAMLLANLFLLLWDYDRLKCAAIALFGARTQAPSCA